LIIKILYWVLTTYSRQIGECSTSITKESISEYFKFITKLQNTKGLSQTVKINKMIRLHVTRFICGSPLYTNDLMIGLTKDGIPKRLNSWVPILRKLEPSDLRIILTCLNISRLKLGDGALDTSSIIQESKIDEKLLQQRSITIADFAVKKLNWLLSPESVEWTEPHLSTKSGPNGQALGSALKDLRSLSEDQLKDLYILGGSKLQDYVNLLMPAALGLNPEPGILRKISVIKDKELKNRPIAIFDYFSQTVLLPVHNMLFSKLRKIGKTDMTFNQMAVESIFKDHPSCFYSLDLSSATDRFPVLLQEIILSKIIGIEKAGAWKRIMSQELRIPGGSYIRYGVGQPMGAYSSWAIFTLCHHIVIQYSAFLVGKPTWFDGYRILGDDIVIFDKEVADQYKEIIHSLGVDISEAKSHVSKDTFEFAKRWFHKGIEISPFPINGIIENMSNPHGLALELYNATKKSWSNTTCQGYPGVDSIRSLLKCLGWSKRSISIRAPFISICFSFYNALNTTSIIGQDRSIQSLVSLLGYDSANASGITWIEGFMDILKDVKLEELSNGIQVALDKNASSLQNCWQMISKLSAVCKPPANPVEISLSIPYLRVLGLQTQKLQGEMDKLQNNIATTPSEILSLGAGIRYPDPDRISSMRTSQVIVNRTGATLHKLISLYRETHIEFKLPDTDAPE